MANETIYHITEIDMLTGRLVSPCPHDLCLVTTILTERHRDTLNKEMKENNKDNELFYINECDRIMKLRLTMCYRCPFFAFFCSFPITKFQKSIYRGMMKGEKLLK